MVTESYCVPFYTTAGTGLLTVFRSMYWVQLTGYPKRENHEKNRENAEIQGISLSGVGNIPSFNVSVSSEIFS
jgi:hypothetical protein